MHPLFGEMANMQVSSKNLIFHLLDIHSRDQRIERETEEVREVVYESGQEDSDEECKSRVRARAGNSGERRCLRPRRTDRGTAPGAGGIPRRHAGHADGPAA